MRLKNKFNKIYSFLKTKHLIETSFLIPITEDKSVGSGDFHPQSRWNKLYDQLYFDFQGYSVGRELFDGCYKDPDTGERVYDTSRKIYVALKPKDLNKMRSLLKAMAAIFCQKSIYFVAKGVVELIEPKKDG